MKKLVLFFIIACFFTTSSFAQFEVGKHHAGPSISIGFGGWGLGFGADYEYGMSLKDIGVDAPGTLGVGGIFRYYNWSEDFFYGEWSYTDIIIGAQGNYHFKLDNSKLDPWVGVVLGFDIDSYSYDSKRGYDDYNYSTSSGGGLFFNGNAGVRYWFSPNMAGRATFGFGNLVSSIVLGVDFKF
ncbi:MAG: hypothetical protein OQJ81_03105 [Melioribacteraceae bacterium]|nr:hypothetical protein [Melioribacteraceae bacterium]